MSSFVRAYASLAGIVALLVLTTILAILVASSSEIETRIEADIVRSRAQAWHELTAALSHLSASWKPDQTRFEIWSGANPVAHVHWESLSGKLNLNTVSPFVLNLPDLQRHLVKTSVQQFVEWRSLNGPIPDGQKYAEWIEPETFQSWFTVYSLWNLNTADEIMLEKVIALRSGATVASAVRETIRGYRKETKRIVAGDRARVLGTSGAQLESLVTLEPELNVNDIDPILLGVLLANPVWNVDQPQYKAASIVKERESRPLGKARLAQVLDVADDNLLLSYLGSRTRFLGGQVSLVSGTLDFVVYFDGQDESKVKPRVLKAIWTPHEK